MGRSSAAVADTGWCAVLGCRIRREATVPLLRSISTSSVNLRYVDLTSRAASQPSPPLRIALRRSATDGSAQLALGLVPVGDRITRDAIAFQIDVISPFSNLIFRPRPRRSARDYLGGRASGGPRCPSSRGSPSRPGWLVPDGLSALLSCHSVNLLAFDTMATVAFSRFLCRFEAPPHRKSQLNCLPAAFVPTSYQGAPGYVPSIGRCPHRHLAN